MIKKLLLPLIALFLCIGSQSANAAGLFTKTFYFKVTVSATEGQGTVFVTDGSADAPQESEYRTSYTNTFKAEVSYNAVWSPPSSATGSVNLYAKAEDGYVFSHWVDKDGKKVTDAKVSITSSTTSSSSAPQYTYTAIFVKSPITIATNDAALGTVSLTYTGDAPAIGSKVTVTATKTYKRKGEIGRCYSAGHVFDGWFDETGACVSTDLVYSFTLEKETELTARFHLDHLVTSANGFYRPVFYNKPFTVNGKKVYEYLTLVSASKPFTSIPALQRTDISSTIKLLNDPNDPRCIVQLKGTFKDPGDDISGEVVVLDGVEMLVQGVSTKNTLGSFNLQIRQTHNPGFYKICATSSGAFGTTGVIEAYSHASLDPNSLAITKNHPDEDIQDVNSYYDMQPLDEDHMDTFYWGVVPDASMEWDGYLWASMYTSYPYTCHDGVEAYYISEFKTLADGTTVAMLAQIEDGRVPAATAVLLKCPVDGAYDADGTYRLVPSIDDFEPLPANYLKGAYQLDGTTKVSFNAATMRVFGVNDAGIVGFYKMANGVELTANRAYLDLSSLPDPAAAKIVLRHADQSGIENVTIDTPADPDAPKAIYDILGRPVDHMTPGNLYIINGRKVLYND